MSKTKTLKKKENLVRESLIKNGVDPKNVDALIKKATSKRVDNGLKKIRDSFAPESFAGVDRKEIEETFKYPSFMSEGDRLILSELKAIHELLKNGIFVVDKFV